MSSPPTCTPDALCPEVIEHGVQIGHLEAAATMLLSDVRAHTTILDEMRGSMRMLMWLVPIVTALATALLSQVADRILTIDRSAHAAPANASASPPARR